MKKVREQYLSSVCSLSFFHWSSPSDFIFFKCLQSNQRHNKMPNPSFFFSSGWTDIIFISFSVFMLFCRSLTIWMMFCCTLMYPCLSRPGEQSSLEMSHQCWAEKDLLPQSTGSALSNVTRVTVDLLCCKSTFSSHGQPVDHTHPTSYFAKLFPTPSCPIKYSYIMHLQ